MEQGASQQQVDTPKRMIMEIDIRSAYLVLFSAFARNQSRSRHPTAQVHSVFQEGKQNRHEKATLSEEEGRSAHRQNIT
jgi:hypothetical protein